MGDSFSLRIPHKNASNSYNMSLHSKFSNMNPNLSKIHSTVDTHQNPLDAPIGGASPKKLEVEV